MIFIRWHINLFDCTQFVCLPAVSKTLFCNVTLLVRRKYFFSWFDLFERSVDPKVFKSSFQTSQTIQVHNTKKTCFCKRISNSISLPAGHCQIDVAFTAGWIWLLSNWKQNVIFTLSADSISLFLDDIEYRYIFLPPRTVVKMTLRPGKTSYQVIDTISISMSIAFRSVGVHETDWFSNNITSMEIVWRTWSYPINLRLSVSQILSDLNDAEFEIQKTNKMTIWLIW